MKLNNKLQINNRQLNNNKVQHNNNKMFKNQINNLLKQKHQFKLRISKL